MDSLNTNTSYTNKEKFEEIFGFEPNTNTCLIPKSKCNGNPAECNGCQYDDWWTSEYKAKE